MKIFNWVHRRFTFKDEVTGNRKDNLGLLENAAFDGWNEGILAIGTLGLTDPALFKGLEPEDDSEISRKELLAGNEDESGDQLEREMEFPLVLKASKHGFFHDQKDDHPQFDQVPKLDDHENKVADIAGVDTDQVRKARETGERITLADLFWADSEKNNTDHEHHHVKLHNHTTDDQYKKKKNDSNDDRLALISEKKLTKDNTTRTINKINRMVKKMLKKKIHPDVQNHKETAGLKPMQLPGSIMTT